MLNSLILANGWWANNDKIIMIILYINGNTWLVIKVNILKAY